MIILLFPHVEPITPPLPEHVTRIQLIEKTNDLVRRDAAHTERIDSLAKELSMETKGKRERILVSDLETLLPAVEIPKQTVTEKSRIIITEPLLQGSKESDRTFFNGSEDRSGEGDKRMPRAISRLEFQSFLNDEQGQLRSPAWRATPGIDLEKGKRRLSPPSKEFKEILPGEEKPEKLMIEWEEGTPRIPLYIPSDDSSYQGQVEGKMQFRFWVDKSGQVVKAVPLKKLSPELEERALRYVLSYRFEPSEKYEMQEGIITINFMLD